MAVLLLEAGFPSDGQSKSPSPSVIYSRGPLLLTTVAYDQMRTRLTELLAEVEELQCKPITMHGSDHD